MEAIGHFLQELGKRSPRQVLSPEQQLDKMLRSSHYLKEFQEQNQGLSRDDYLRALPTVYQAVKEHYWCENCPGLVSCPNMVKGHYTTLDMQASQVVGALAPCSKQLAAEDEKRRHRLMRSYYVSEEIKTATFAGIKGAKSKLAAVEAAIRFSGEYIPGEKKKGLYLHGPFGVGKSYIMGAIAQKLAERGIASLMVYVPEFVREMKESLSDHSYGSKLELLKEVPVLILDDLGAENLTPWIRDEILGVLLHHRVNNRLPTLYTSNYSLEELADHLAISNGNRVEVTKAHRILERIRHYVDVFMVDGDNRRK
ncbi:primosomal protein DnaI [Brevibacillus humidisoli]|uniref:primosomal protein DnaI n=1 Tax=Brevibacillus humidisoli TaxID=2895522 RepID=UPI001E30240A|nr:primosomal protein DnaI [Brevibacillus humidisoli]UFJ41553.1 primosomal protein DnaI [Brevibacillus humidisoli]